MMVGTPPFRASSVICVPSILPFFACQLEWFENGHHIFDTVKRIQRLQTRFAAFVPHAGDDRPLFAKDGVNLISEFAYLVKNVFNLSLARAGFHDDDHLNSKVSSASLISSGRSHR